MHHSVWRISYTTLLIITLIHNDDRQGVWRISYTELLFVTVICNAGTSFKKYHKVDMGCKHGDNMSPFLPRSLSSRNSNSSLNRRFTYCTLVSCIWGIFLWLGGRNMSITMETVHSFRFTPS